MHMFFLIISHSFCLFQISLLEMPEHRRKILMALTTNVMRDKSDKVKLLIFFLLILLPEIDHANSIKLYLFSVTAKFLKTFEAL